MEARPRGLGRRIQNRLAGGAQLAREFHNEDRILCRQCHQENEPDLDVEIVVEPALRERRERQNRPDEGERDRKNDRDRGVPALVLPGEHQISATAAATKTLRATMAAIKPAYQRSIRS